VNAADTALQALEHVFVYGTDWYKCTPTAVYCQGGALDSAILSWR